MVMIRVTPPTALPTVRQLTTDLGRMLRDVGKLNSGPGLRDLLNALDEYAGKPTLDVDLVTVGLDAASLQAIQAWLAPGAEAEAAEAAPAASVARTPVAAARPLVVTTRELGQPTGQRAGTPRPAILVIAVGATESGDDRQAVERIAEERPVAFVVAPADRLEAWTATLQPLAWVTEALALETLQPGGLPRKLSSAQWAPVADVLHAYAVAAALDSCVQTFAQAVDQEARSLKVKRALVQQRATTIQQRPGGTGTELLSELRTRVQRQFTDFERGGDDRLQDLLAVPTGSLWKEVEARVAGLNELQQEERNKTITFRLPPQMLEELTTMVRERFLAHCHGDLRALADHYKLVANEIEQLLARYEAPAVVPQFRYLTDERLGRVLEGAFTFGRAYSGQAPRPGFFEYVMIARRYQMLLFMGLSAFGVASLRQHSQLMVPAAVVLLSFGALNVYNTTKREQVETLEKELEKARESLRADLKRVFADLQRGWQGIVSQHLADEVPSVVQQLDQAVRENQSRRLGDAAAEKDRVQRQLQGQETLERRLAPAVKGREMLTASLGQVRGELRQMILTAHRTPPPPPRPAASTVIGGRR